jgi:hypothetical protein
VDRPDKFVSDSKLQTALREMQVLARSARLWLTFCAVVLLFAVTGPYGTAQSLAFLPRLAYWLLLHAGAWTFALVFAVAADAILSARVSNRLLRMLAGSLFAAVPIGCVISILEQSWFGVPLSWDSLASNVVSALPLSAIFCVITWLALSGQTQNGEEAAPASIQAAQTAPQAPSREVVPLMERLSAENRGRLQHISVEDHYCRIRTSRGSELLLMRFADAIRETGTAEGLQVHRSHWVARDYASGFRTSDGKLMLVLRDGTVVPVSRTHAARVRKEFPPLPSKTFPTSGDVA